ncbi:hypothetical protein Ddye_021198 [Dipteronia dyeriana]|uniref:Aspartate racemase n=1 Tax=Dipteronia dyeriana TaxID=168575 RepID=A0AAD9U1M7_9ROSI|nr:hypothetical protein Ddye_021198 [Dipteronia dyeriana]
MFDGGGMIMSFHALNCPPSLLSNVNKTLYRTRPTSPLSLLMAQTVESGNFPQSSKNSGTGATIKKRRSPKHLLNQPNTVGIIGGASVSSTLIFLEKLVLWSTRDAEECLPFVVCSDPSLNEELIYSHTSLCSSKARTSQIRLNDDRSIVVENLQRKRAFLEKSGARCIVMPCHISHNWHAEISEGCSLPFLHVGECVARELKEAKLKPLEAGSGVRIGLLAADGILSAGFYQEKLQSQGFEVVLPDKATIEHMLIPAVESLNKRDMEGAQNLLRIAIQVLLVRAVNVVVLASDDIRGVLPHDDPLLKKCVDPMDALARSTIKWARSIKKVHKRSAK